MHLNKYIFTDGQFSHLLLGLSLGFIGLLSGCSSEHSTVEANHLPSYVTWRSQEPDTLASIWLVENLIAPGVEVELLPPGAPINPDSIAIAIPEAKFARQGQRSAFASLLDAHQLKDPGLWRLNSIIETIEISPWQRAADRQAMLLEENFRRAQQQFGEDLGCLVRFFDYAYEAIQADRIDQLPQQLWETGSFYSQCQNSNPLAQAKSPVRLSDTGQILDWMNLGKSVLFIDTRENAEFEMGHIPGAQNIRLRDMDSNIVAQLDDYDLVIPYCVKDFRGYEVARWLANQGLSNLHVMDPHGIAGWRQLGLPISQGPSAPEAEQATLKQLSKCQGAPNRCIAAAPSP